MDFYAAYAERSIAISAIVLHFSLVFVFVFVFNVVHVSGFVVLLFLLSTAL
jgi:hypothetical protein